MLDDLLGIHITMLRGIVGIAQFDHAQQVTVGIRLTRLRVAALTAATPQEAALRAAALKAARMYMSNCRCYFFSCL